MAFVDLARGETNRHVPGASPAVAPAVHIKLTLPGRSSGVKAGGASAAFGAPLCPYPWMRPHAFKTENRT